MQKYSEGVRKVLVATLLLNILVVIVKIIAGLLANSLALISDGVHSSVDGLNNIIGLVVLRYSTKAPDADHPYGHQKIETLAAFCIAGFLAISCYEIGSRAVIRLIGSAPETVHITPLTFAAILVTLAVNIFVTIYESGVGRKLKSQFLLADAAHTKSDVYVTIAVLAGTILMELGFLWMDGVFALLVAFFIARAGYGILRETVPILVDASALPDGEVRSLVASIEGVAEVRNIRTRGFEGHYFFDLTIVAPVAENRLAHEVTEHIEAALHQRYGDAMITVHVEPE